MRELEYPFDGNYLLKKRKSLKRLLLEEKTDRIRKRIAVLGGSTTHNVIQMLELFLLNYGIEGEFYESGYNRYYEDGVFGNQELSDFRPDLIYIHTTSRNVPEKAFPAPGDTREKAEEKLDEIWNHFRQIWESLSDRFHCPIIQNNFEKPFFRLMGNMDVWDFRGRGWFLGQLNQRFCQYAAEHEDFLIQDIDWLSADYGLSRWDDPLYWHMYKCSPAVPAVPDLAFNLANMVKALYGKNKKALALDLDNTLWGGVVGDDGPEAIEIGQETGMAQVYSEFQTYVKACKELGILLNVNSKNQEENALAGLRRPDSILKPEDFIVVKANWEPKDRNLKEIAKELNIGEDALVFVDDNPAERHMVKAQCPQTAAPEITEGQQPQPERYIRILDRSGFFEGVRLSADDLKRNDMYRENALRKRQEAAFSDYGQYLESLEMKGEIGSFPPEYMARIAQLTNKSNQFNLTTRRYTEAQLKEFAQSEEYLDLYGKLEDRFGDNGVVSVVLGKQEGETLHILLWLMSCRVLKRDMEKAMLDELVRRAGERGISKVRGYYYPTPKNAMVKEFYKTMGFGLIEEKEDGAGIWEMEIKGYAPQNRAIRIKRT